MSELPTPPLSAQFPPKEGPDPPAGFHYLVKEDDTPWTPSFASTDKIDEDKAWSSGQEKATGDDQKPPLWATSKRKGRRISLQLPSITTTSAGNDNRNTDDLLPIASPAVASARASPDKPYFPGQPKSLEGIALRAFCLGVSLAVSVIAVLITLVFTSSPLWRLPFFAAALSTFHFLEFWTTAKYNTKEATVDSFLLTSNWPMYAIAHSSASIECFLTKLIWPNRAWAPLYTGHILLLIGLILVFLGQFVRATSMMQLGTNFNHLVQHKKRMGHELITSGIYGAIRHPAYFGFWWWGLGTQLVLGNPICFVAYSVVLWKFFSSRITVEEHRLTQFFPEDYPEYKKRVPTRIPFIA